MVMFSASMLTYYLDDNLLTNPFQLIEVIVGWSCEHIPTYQNFLRVKGKSKSDSKILRAKWIKPSKIVSVGSRRPAHQTTVIIFSASSRSGKDI